MQLQFIDQGRIGPKERQRIRSHVMKGKNAGRPRPSRRKQPSKRIVQRVEPLAQGTRDNSTEIKTFDHTMRLLPLLWDDLALISFPQQLNSKSRTLLHQWFLVVGESLYPPEFCFQFDILDSIWVYSVFADQAYFHCTLAIAASFADVFLGKARVSSRALTHISHAYSFVNKKLSGPEAVSDEALAVVTMLAIYQRLHQQHSIGLIHFNGLRRMVQLRGGIAKISRENRALALKPWRLCLEFALQDGSPPRFLADDMPISSKLVEFRMSYPAESVFEHLIPRLNPKLLSLFFDIASFAKALNNSKLDPLDYSEASLLLLHRLIQFAPLGGPRPINGMDNLVHLTLVAFMTTHLLSYSQDYPKHDLLSSQLRGALQHFAHAARESHKFVIWALLIGSVTIFKNNEYSWLLPLAKKTCQFLDLHAWLDIRRILCKYPWFYAVHDKGGKALWEIIKSHDGHRGPDGSSKWKGNANID